MSLIFHFSCHDIARVKTSRWMVGGQTCRCGLVVDLYRTKRISEFDLKYLGSRRHVAEHTRPPLELSRLLAFDTVDSNQ